MKIFNVMIMVLVAVAVIAILTSCASTPPPTPRIQTVEVKVAVPVECEALTRLGPEPDYPDSDAELKAAPDLFERVKLLLQGRYLRLARLAQYEAARASC